MSFIESDIQAELSAHYLAVHRRLWAGPPRQAYTIPRPAPAPQPAPPAPPPEQPRPFIEVAEYWRRRDKSLGLFDPSLEKIIHVTAAYFGVTAEALKTCGKGSRAHALPRARKAAIYLAQCLFPRPTYCSSVRLFFQRDHSSLCHYRNCAKELIKTDRAFAVAIEELSAVLRTGITVLPPKPPAPAVYAWSKDDETLLADLCSRGYGIHQIAAVIGCTKYEAKNKARQRHILVQTAEAIRGREKLAVIRSAIRANREAV